MSVLRTETIEGLKIKSDGIYVDGTLGAGGHSKEIVKKLTTGRLIAFDQDEQAIEAAKERLSHYHDKISFIHANFRYLKVILTKMEIDEVDGFLFDLGVSSPQLDQLERGFSYHDDAPLDMRMDQSQDLTAYDVVNNSTYQELVSMFFKYGEERFSKQIARKIESSRVEKPIETTKELVEIIKDAIPAATRRTGGHPAKRVFQAIRIVVNEDRKSTRLNS